ncbi:MAG: methylated-DNA--[protein]-cysteine S-methyltransferase [Candidatus Tectomicrobia bacterium]|uniref:Methylated-DNA--protein-cysteine methyltransferase n=1 Tax=Tectimicrobiota bacterium TaxID=2528274 RepID=A0A937W524_UNCTE|nr:methylated-DNA--[protein]-cysteine S-methyltransferase [Candidatus Tectomicrobia bacterium]
MPSPLGLVCLARTLSGLIRVDFQTGNRPIQVPHCWQQDPDMLRAALQQMQEYFAAQRQHFTLELAPRGTPFQQRVWRALQHIPFGSTLTYQALARQLGMPGAARAVGHANGRNPIAIVIPCHRLIGSDGRLRGYAGGLALKQRLLQHEGIDCDVLPRTSPRAIADSLRM